MISEMYLHSSVDIKLITEISIGIKALNQTAGGNMSIG